MRRREFTTLLGSAAVAWPLVARAQPTLPVIGFLGETPDLFASRLKSFRQGLGEMGFVEAQNVRIDTAGLRATTIGCRRWQTILFVGRW
jgi:putative ABC transport system substrate-binding protein